ncbi:hypothetical protein GPJ56_003280 [Histomonas meleagridis]|uniref:uncharacterized protein n=1 Tax=Histomonas meleagridis TaxID=135588 RepID=UPI003559A608|nr:hypothetical protein GPJ56_003280 [Histomonas meleagridis]KAH0805941.1 hypothetical protein GO595_001272 [Histomonas meleagridis]
MPLFSNVYKTSIDRLRKVLNSDDPKIDTFDKIFAEAQQDDITYFGTWKTNSGRDLPCPTITLHFLGSYGFDVFIRQPLESNNFKVYYDMMDKTWNFMLQQHDGEFSPMLALFILLIWIIQPISHFQCEIGWIIMNAFVLAAKNTELKNIEIRELFPSQLVQPNIEEMNSIVSEHLANNSIASEVDEGSLKYWENEPTVEQMLNLIKYDNTADDTKSQTI